MSICGEIGYFSNYGSGSEIISASIGCVYVMDEEILPKFNFDTKFDIVLIEMLQQQINGNSRREE